MVRKAIELGNTRRGGLSSIVEKGDWVVVKPRIAVHRKADGLAVTGSVAKGDAPFDPRAAASAPRRSSCTRLDHAPSLQNRAGDSEPDRAEPPARHESQVRALLNLISIPALLTTLPRATIEMRGGAVW